MSPLNSLLLLLCPLSTDDWPQWRGPTAADSVEVEQPFEGTLEVAWRSRIGSGYSGIAIDDGRVVTMASRDGRDGVVALDEATGKVLWRHDFAETFLGQDGAADGPLSTPTLADGSVFALGPRGHLLALDADSGERRWMRDLVAEDGALCPHWGFTTSPFVGQGLVVVSAGGAEEGKAHLAFDAQTGEPRWAAGTDSVSYQSPLLLELLGEETLVAFGDRNALGLDLLTGGERWSFAHGGDGFYQRIVCPTKLYGDALLLKHRTNHAQAIALERLPSGEVDTYELWTSRHLTRNYNFAILHEGFLYGHNSSFMVCIDADTGELQWKSRPPGNGWLIRVGGNLVALTKEGSLHVAPASPDGYSELASLVLFEHTTWTPPSFANGRVFARDSFDEIACVGVRPAEENVLAGGGQGAPQGLLAMLAEELASASDPEPLIERFLAKHERMPILEGERMVHFVYAGDARDVALSADLIPGRAERPLPSLGGTRLRGASFEVSADARFSYSFREDFGTAIRDPRNPLEAVSIYGEPVSLVEMPAWKGTPLPALSESPRGQIVEERQGGEARLIGPNPWRPARELEIYLPPGYEDSGERYPTVYFQHGANEVPGILDAWIAAGNPPMIAVFVQGMSAYEYARSHREAYRKLLVEEIVPRIDAAYRTRPEPSARVLVGADESGHAACSIAFLHADVFGRPAAHSIHSVSPRIEDDMLRALEEASVLPDRIYLGWGRYDGQHPTLGVSVETVMPRVARAARARDIPVFEQVTADGSFQRAYEERLPRMLEALLLE